MIVFNTTYHVAKAQTDRFLEWVKSEYVPAVLCGGELSSPRLMLVLIDDEENEGNSYSLQFNVKNQETLSRWYHECGAVFNERQKRLFGEDVLAFSTLLEVVDL